MSPSRRVALGIAGTAALALVAGCSGMLNGASTDADGPNAGSADTDIEVRLRGSDTDRLLFDGTDVAAVGRVQNRRNGAALPVSLTDGATADVSEVFRTVGVGTDPDAFEIVLLHDGETVNRSGIAPGLAENIADGTWEGRFLLTFERREQATALREVLVAGVSPTRFRSRT